VQQHYAGEVGKLVYFVLHIFQYAPISSMPIVKDKNMPSTVK